MDGVCCSAGRAHIPTVIRRSEKISKKQVVVHKLRALRFLQGPSLFVGRFLYFRWAEIPLISLTLWTMYSLQRQVVGMVEGPWVQARFLVFQVC